MNFVIYSKYLGGGSGAQLLAKRAEELGHRASIVNNLNEAHTATEKLGHVDIFIARFEHSTYRLAAEISAFFENKKALVAADADSILTSFDKFKTYQKLQSLAISTPKTILVEDIKQLAEVKVGIGLPAILKPLDENQGNGIVIVEDETRLTQGANQLLSQYKKFIAQQFIQEAAGRDIRAFVVGDKVVAAMERTGAGGEKIANMSKGATARNIELKANEEAMAVSALKAMGAAFAGVDLIRGKEKTYVIEVNVSPGFKIESVTGVEVSRLAIMDLIQRRQND